MKDTFRLCRKCGRPIGVIKEGIYKNILVEAEAVPVLPDKLGDIYIKVDGTKIRGLEMPIGERPEGAQTEYAYRPHHCNGL